MAENKLIYDLDGMRLPYSVEAEQAVLGSLIIDPQCYKNLADSVKSEFFYLPQHKKIFETLATMCELSQAVDIVSLLEKLKKNGIYDEAGGKAYLTQLVQTVPTSANVLTYASIVRDRYYARSLMNAAQEIIKDINEDSEDADMLITSAEQKIYNIRQGREVSGLTHIKSVIENETYDRLNKISNPETRGDYIGIPTGLGDLDRMITGLNKSDLLILGARPGMGKTAFALNIARNVAVNENKTVCFFSLEMSRDQLAQRLLSSEAGIPSAKLRTGELDTDEWVRLAQAGEVLSKTQMFLDETPGITVREMKAKLLRMKKVDLVVVDYLGLMKSDVKKENRVQEVSDITRNLKIMAKELKIPLLVCAQLSRGTEGKGSSHKPGLSDLRESGSIEQDADIVMFLYREKYYDNEKKDNEEKGDPNKAECIVAKNRHGEIGTVDLYWNGQFTRFTSLDVYRQ